MLRTISDGTTMSRQPHAPALTGLRLVEFDNRETTASPPQTSARPKSLTIRFARASDMDKVIDLYTGERKKNIDPGNFVRPRNMEELSHPVQYGAAVLALDENGVIRASALAERLEDGACGRKNITEIGAVLCDVGGVGLSKTLLAMLSLKQAFDPKASKQVYAKVARNNTASNAVFEKSLQWEPVECEEQSRGLYDIAYKNKQGLRDRLWYYFSRKAENKAIRILEQCAAQEGLNGKDGIFIPVNTDKSSIWSTLHFHNMLSRE
jgi:hypothetical protein